MDYDHARARVQTWSTKDTLAVRTALEQYGVPIAPTRWPYTYSADYMRLYHMEFQESRSQAAQYTTRLAEMLDVSRDFLCCLFATAHLGIIPEGLLAMFAIAIDPTVREIFTIAHVLGISPKSINI